MLFQAVVIFFPISIFFKISSKRLKVHYGGVTPSAYHTGQAEEHFWLPWETCDICNASPMFYQPSYEVRAVRARNTSKPSLIPAIS